MILGILQIGGAIPNGAIELITSAALSTKIVLAVLAVLSLLSWAVMFGAWRQLNKAERAGLQFQHAFEHAPRLDEAGALVKRSSRGRCRACSCGPCTSCRRPVCATSRCTR